MKKAIVWVLALAAIAALIVPLHDSLPISAEGVDDVEDEPIVIGDEMSGLETSDYSYWGFVALIALLGAVGLMIFLEHKGVLKDPLLY